MRRTLLVLTLVLAACGGGDEPAERSGIEPVTFTITEDGRDITMRVGDELIVVVPLTDPAWSVIERPSLGSLESNGSFAVIPSEADQGDATVEWSWEAVGPGDTSVTLRGGTGTISVDVIVVE